MDIVDKTTRSRMMAGIKGKDTRTELSVRRFLHARGFRFRLHPAHLPGKPDIVLPKFKVCIFVHGCFWHRHKLCRFAYNPKSRQEFWQRKFDANVARDRRTVAMLRESGWKVLEIWECGLRSGASLEWLPEAIRQGREEVWPTYAPRLNEPQISM